MPCVMTIRPNRDSGEVFGTRFSALAFRETIEERLDSCPSVQVDFGGAFVTQSFIDELLGPVILRMGPAILERLEFAGCLDSTRAILQLVIAARLEDFADRQAAKSSSSPLFQPASQ